jgi:hypothetical protein
LEKKKHTNSNNKSSASRTLEDLGGLSIEDLGMVFLTYNNKRERRGEERRGEKSRAH